MFIIGDGSGKGFKAKVDNFLRLRTFSTNTSQEHHAASLGVAFMYSTVKTAPTLTLAAATETPVFFIQNNDPNKIMTIQKVYLSSEAAGARFTYIKNQVLGTIGANTVVTGDNTNFSSGVIAAATSHAWDETGAGLTGLTAGTNVMSHSIGAESFIDPLDGSIDLVSGNSLTISAFITAGGEVSVGIRVFFESTEG